MQKVGPRATIPAVADDMNIFSSREKGEDTRIKSVVKLGADSSRALNQPANVAGVPGRAITGAPVCRSN